MASPSYPSEYVVWYDWRILTFDISFADRQFYEDWWNSTSWDEFSRKWNKPVHAFLLRHVYASTISTYHLSRSSAMFVTFLLSACVHELVMAIVTQKIRYAAFAMYLG
jgi:sterol O-acyltransferase